MAFEHLRASGFAASNNAAIISVDRDVAAALLCGLAAAGLMVGRVRPADGVCIVLGITYMLSARQLAGTLGLDALTYGPLLTAALYVCWPQLNRAES